MSCFKKGKALRFLPVNLTTLLIELESLAQTIALYRNLSEDPLCGVKSLLPAARTILVHFNPSLITGNHLAAAIRQRVWSDGILPNGRLVTIGVSYQGQDLNWVAEYLSLSTAELIEWHTSQRYQVAFTGFAPGFAYLMASKATYSVPRHATPRAKIPAGAVGLAGEFSGVYPKESPGGWQLIGQTEQPMWEPHRQPPALCSPGDQVQFVDISKTSVAITRHTSPVSSRIHHCVKPYSGLLIERSGILSTLQDQGRQSASDQGVSPSGALDQASAQLANQLLGNPAKSAVIELTYGGLHAQAQGNIEIALTGAPCLADIVDGQQQVWPVTWQQPIALAKGDRLRIAAPLKGIRSYLAVRGGWVGTSILDSVSYDSLAQMGSEPLQKGDCLAYSPPATLCCVQPSVVHSLSFEDESWVASGESITLDVIMGPHSDWFTQAALTTFSEQKWKVTTQADRIGVRLSGAQTLERCLSDELPSEGIVTGAIQVPADGNPLIFLRDHPLTGGYPVIACIADYHLNQAAQLPPGAVVTFRPIQAFKEI